ncbi:MAG: J domain-containing protein [Pseudomonadales bacterium]|jgi:DnaJ-class molecular chaperone|nr:J domain-containing protein [Pseudomonadales bacterium]
MFKKLWEQFSGGREDTLYKTLKLKDFASAKDVKNAYRKLALTAHPDRDKSTGATERFQKINEAYKILSNPDKKGHYDLTLKAEKEIAKEARSKGKSTQEVREEAGRRVSYQPMSKVQSHFVMGLFIFGVLISIMAIVFGLNSLLSGGGFFGFDRDQTQENVDGGFEFTRFLIPRLGD